MDYTHIIVGGGMFGCYAAIRLVESSAQARVAIIEREDELLQRASYNNQARIHNGYHYPRSIVTGLRSRVNAPRFQDEFKDAVFSDFEQYYAIARSRSNVTPSQFEQFCRHIGAELKPAPAHIGSLFDKDLIEAVYSVTECVFDAAKLRDIMQARLKKAGIETLTETEALQITPARMGAAPRLHVDIRDRRTNESQTLSCAYLLNCTYSGLNHLLGRSGLNTIRLRHEATEMALIELPPSLHDFSVTVMCGPFFSLMPFPARGLATLSHVSYTPHYGWSDHAGPGNRGKHEPAFPLASNFERMSRDATRYLPALKDARQVDSLWEVKTILPQSDASDSRPILFKRDPKLPNVVSLLGGKIDNIYDLDALLPQLAGSATERAFA